MRIGFLHTVPALAPPSARTVILSASYVILSAAKNLAQRQILRCAQDDARFG